MNRVYDASKPNSFIKIGVCSSISLIAFSANFLAIRQILWKQINQHTLYSMRYTCGCVCVREWFFKYVRWLIGIECDGLQLRMRIMSKRKTSTTRKYYDVLNGSQTNRMFRMQNTEIDTKWCGCDPFWSHCG